MSEPFLGEVRIMSFSYAPRGWAQCNGQSMAINQNQALFSLLGTTFGGNGQTTFNLPNMQGRAQTHTGSGFVLGQSGGEQSHTLSIGEVPNHTHAAGAANVPATAGNPSNARQLSQSTGANLYAAAAGLQAMAATNIGNYGGSQPHNNMQPYLVLNFCIALQGIFPSRN